MTALEVIDWIHANHLEEKWNQYRRRTDYADPVEIALIDFYKEWAEIYG